jgi:hypothetical protein
VVYRPLPVCTENLIRVDDAMESPKLAECRAALFRSRRPGLAIQVEVIAATALLEGG